MRKLAKSCLNSMPAVACCPLNVKFCTCKEQWLFAHCPLSRNLMPCKFHRHTIAKRVLVYVPFTAFVRLLACVCKAVNGLSVFKFCAKDRFYLQNSHFLVNFAVGYEVRSQPLPHRFCEINSLLQDKEEGGVSPLRKGSWHHISIYSWLARIDSRW